MMAGRLKHILCREKGLNMLKLQHTLCSLSYKSLHTHRCLRSLSILDELATFMQIEHHLSRPAAQSLITVLLYIFEHLTQSLSF
jgi:hypothetical protein